MALTYLQISYPNFALGAIIDPEEANQNNFELVNKINDSVVAINKNEVDIKTLDEVKATITYVDEKHSNLAGSGRTTETIRQNALNLISHKSSTDHDGRYYTKTQLDGGQLDNRYYTKTLLNSGQLDDRYFTEAEINTKISVLNQKDTDITALITNHKVSTDHDSRYYTEIEIDTKLGVINSTIENYNNTIHGKVEGYNNTIHNKVNIINAALQKEIDETSSYVEYLDANTNRRIEFNKANIDDLNSELKVVIEDEGATIIDYGDFKDYVTNAVSIDCGGFTDTFGGVFYDCKDFASKRTVVVNGGIF